MQRTISGMRGIEPNCEASSCSRATVNRSSRACAGSSSTFRCGSGSVEKAPVHIGPLSARPHDAALESLRRAIFAPRPDGQLPKIILEVDSTVRFSWILLGREPRSRTELLMVYAAVLAHGTLMSAADIARMVPELSATAIRR
jgi:Tn3 transposase DDE domain